MREDDGVALLAQPIDLGAQIEPRQTAADATTCVHCVPNPRAACCCPMWRGGGAGSRHGKRRIGIERQRAADTARGDRLRDREPERAAPDDLDQELCRHDRADPHRSEEHTSELQSLMRISYAVFCLKKKTPTHV